MKKRKIILIIILIAALALFAFLKSQTPRRAQVFSIVLGKDGFSPAQISVHKGDSVTFTSTAGADFWPASDLHPSHDVYPEFDPKQPVASGDSWTFKFDKIGSWKFHNHLFPSERGVINVEGGTASPAPTNCTDPSGQKQCWDGEIRDTLKKKGLDAAFELLAHLYVTEPEFASTCHDYAHILGGAAYQEFSRNSEFEISSKTSYCGYGFYHGFMEALLQNTGSIEEARKFCSYIGDKLKDQTSDAEGACYHGVGHGAVDGGDPRFWGDPQGMINPSLSMCEKIAGNDRTLHGKLYRCTTGAFNAIEILSNDSKYKLDKILKDPFYLCPTQPPEYKEGCYTNMLPALLRTTHEDFTKSAKIIEQIKEEKDSYEIRTEVMLSLFHEFIRINLSEPDYNAKEGVAICRKLNPRSHLPCIEGLSGGHMKYGEPTREYVKGFDFCNSTLLSSLEKDTCFNFILSRLQIWYGSAKVPQICEMAPLEYRKYCN